ncbi:MAG TPA: aldehyde dehydrogenase family protein [Thermoanaerobaculia bacterium]|nr:aldehyde dehydrogenase family protein [Thermoanaerobaculia bacterium]
MNDLDLLRATALIDGAAVEGGAAIPRLSPVDEEPLGVLSTSDATIVGQALESAQRAQRGWARRSSIERGMVLRKWAAALSAERQRLARLLSREIGKPILEAYGEIDFAAATLQYSAEFDRRLDGVLLQPERRDEQMWIAPEPVGVVAAIITWNAPIALAMRKLAPALIAGNAVVLKPHELASFAVLDVVRLGLGSGIPKGVVNVVVGPGAPAGVALVSSPIPGLVTFTGGRNAGKAIAAQAAEHLPALSLEMGGKAPFLILDDCNLDEAAAATVAAKIRNCGQTCVANERVLVHRSVAAEFLQRLTDRFAALKVGDPLERAVQVGPKVSKAELARIEGLVDRARAAGGQVVCGGSRLRGGAFDRGYWYAPTLLTGVTARMEIMQEEIFGPVLPVMEVESFDEALAVANDSPYGLAACVFTSDVRRVMRALRELECGEVYVNRPPGESVHGFHSGWKQSGVGGDDGMLGLRHYLRHKTVYLRA